MLVCMLSAKKMQMVSGMLSTASAHFSLELSRSLFGRIICRRSRTERTHKQFDRWLQGYHSQLYTAESHLGTKP